MEVSMRTALFAVTAAAAVVLAACGSDTQTREPGAIAHGTAVQIFLKEAYKIGLFQPEDEVEVDSEPLSHAEAQVKAEAVGLALYSPHLGTPPPEGVSGWLVTVRGLFYDLADGFEANGERPRRHGVAMAFIDSTGNLTYAFRYDEE